MTESYEYPILFTTDMVLAILDGTKSQTRRVIKPRTNPRGVLPVHMQPWTAQEWPEVDDQGHPRWLGNHPDYPHGAKWFTCPYGKPGDRLWVRETWAVYGEFKGGTGYCYRADGDKAGVRWKPSIHMRRHIARIILEVTDVRVERVQEISETDARAEGISVTTLTHPNFNPGGLTVYHVGSYPTPHLHDTAVGAYAYLWDAINGKKSGHTWDDNPYVWVVEFRRLA